MIGIVNYGLGNIKAFANIYRRLNIQASLVDSAKLVRTADRLILPGVGAFDHAMNLLNESGLRDALDDSVLNRQIPVLGVCVGLQMMTEGSEEGKSTGLGWIEGYVRKLDTVQHTPSHQIPHMGWNQIKITKSSPLVSGLDDAYFYFLHSYRVVPRADDSVIASTNYGTDFASAISKGHIYGTQFHPEKSHHNGISLLRNFSHIESHSA